MELTRPGLNPNPHCSWTKRSLEKNGNKSSMAEQNIAKNTKIWL
jgi:hypothetical protein